MQDAESILRLRSAVDGNPDRHHGYGVDNYGRVSSRVREDPHVQVSGPKFAIDEGLRERLYCPYFRADLRDYIGAAWPPPRDFGRAQYLFVQDTVRNIIETEFPHMCA